MEVRISIKKANGELIEIVKEVSEVISSDIIDQVDKQLDRIRVTCFPDLLEELVSSEQRVFNEKKKSRKRTE